jgi:hypothetical protein
MAAEDSPQAKAKIMIDPGIEKEFRGEILMSMASLLEVGWAPPALADTPRNMSCGQFEDHILLWDIRKQDLAWPLNGEPHQ